MPDVVIRVHQDDADREQLEVAAGHLRKDLADVHGVEPLPTPPAAEAGGGAKGAKGDLSAAGTVLVALAQAGVVTALVHFLQSWVLGRRGTKVEVVAEDGPRKLTLHFAPGRQPTTQEVADFSAKVMKAVSARKP
jgi:hypothetical protein